MGEDNDNLMRFSVLKSTTAASAILVARFSPRRMVPDKTTFETGATFYFAILGGQPRQALIEVYHD
jgi:hypothetical protein